MLSCRFCLVYSRFGPVPPPFCALWLTRFPFCWGVWAFSSSWKCHLFLMFFTLSPFAPVSQASLILSRTLCHWPLVRGLPFHPVAIFCPPLYRIFFLRKVWTKFFSLLVGELNIWLYVFLSFNNKTAIGLRPYQQGWTPQWLSFRLFLSPLPCIFFSSCLVLWTNMPVEHRFLSSVSPLLSSPSYFFVPCLRVFHPLESTRFFFRVIFFFAWAHIWLFSTGSFFIVCRLLLRVPSLPWEPTEHVPPLWTSCFLHFFHRWLMEHCFLFLQVFLSLLLQTDSNAFRLIPPPPPFSRSLLHSLLLTLRGSSPLFFSLSWLFAPPTLEFFMSVDRSTSFSAHGFSFFFSFVSLMRFFLELNSVCTFLGFWLASFVWSRPEAAPPLPDWPVCFRPTPCHDFTFLFLSLNCFQLPSNPGCCPSFFLSAPLLTRRLGARPPLPTPRFAFFVVHRLFHSCFPKGFFFFFFSQSITLFNFFPHTSTPPFYVLWPSFFLRNVAPGKFVLFPISSSSLFPLPFQPGFGICLPKRQFDPFFFFVPLSPHISFHTLPALQPFFSFTSVFLVVNNLGCPPFSSFDGIPVVSVSPDLISLEGTLNMCSSSFPSHSLRIFCPTPLFLWFVDAFP